MTERKKYKRQPTIYKTYIFIISIDYAMWTYDIFQIIFNISGTIHDIRVLW
jgi:hypothetical protein